MSGSNPWNDPSSRIKTKNGPKTKSKQQSRSTSGDSGKSAKDSTDESKRKAEIEAKIRRRVALEEKAFRLVEKLLENPISEQFLIETGQHITHDHYSDIVEERAITKYCGYPVCANKLTNIPKQKYHISTKSNKVYDITERKNFCRPQCYKASKYFEKQLSMTPVWLREHEPPVKFDLLGIDSNCGSVGELVITSPSAEIRAELDYLDHQDRRLSQRSAKPTPRSCSKKVTLDADLCCEGQAIGVKTDQVVPNVVQNVTSQDVRTDLIDSFGNHDHQVPEVVTNDGAGDRRPAKQTTDAGCGPSHMGVATTGDPLIGRDTSCDLRIDLSSVVAPELDSQDCLVENVARSLSQICIEQSLENLKVLENSEEVQGVGFHGNEDRVVTDDPLSKVELWKDGEVSSRSHQSTNEIVTGSANQSTRSDAQCKVSTSTGSLQMEPLSLGMPSMETPMTTCRDLTLSSVDYELMYDHDVSTASSARSDNNGVIPESSTEENTAAMGSSVHSQNHPIEGSQSESMTSSRLNQSVEFNDGLATKKYEITPRSKSGKTCSLGMDCVPGHTSYGMEEISVTSNAAINKANVLAELSQSEANMSMKDMNVGLSEQGLQRPLEAGVHGLKMNATVSCTADKKSKVLAELLDQRDVLKLKLAEPSTGHDEQAVQCTEAVSSLSQNPDTVRSGQSSNRSLRFLQFIDDIADDSEKMESKSNSAESVSESNVISRNGELCQGRKISSKVSSASVLTNIQRASEQKGRLQQTKTSMKSTTPSSSRTQATDNTPELRSQSKMKKRSKISVLDLIKQTLFDWKTPETAKFLTRKSRSESDFKDRYAEYNRRLANREISGLIGEEEICEDDSGPEGRLPSVSQLQSDVGYSERVKEFYGAKNKQGGAILKTTAKKTKVPSPEKEVVLPMVDSHSQMSHRRKIVLDKLNRVFPDLLGPLKLSVSEVSGDLRSLVHTFNLTSTNIILKPAEWTLIAYFLLHLLSQCCLDLSHAMQGELATHYFKTMLLSVNISASDVRFITENMCSLDARD